MLNTMFILACSACAFVCGGILGKAYIATRDTTQPATTDKSRILLEAQRARYRKRMSALNKVIRHHEEIRVQIKDRLTAIETKHEERGQALKQSQVQLETEQKKNLDLEEQLNKLLQAAESTAKNEEAFSMLRIERDELAARIVRLEAELQDQANEPAEVLEDKLAQMREITGELRESLATRDRRVHDLELQLNDNIEQTRTLQSKLDNWKQRVKPLTQQLKQQKELISQIRNQAGTPAPTDAPADNLQVIQGIGPALENKLNQHGIRLFRQLAALSTDELTEISRQLSIAPNIPVRDGWIEQARNLSATEEITEPA